MLKKLGILGFVIERGVQQEMKQTVFVEKPVLLAELICLRIRKRYTLFFHRVFIIQ